MKFFDRERLRTKIGLNTIYQVLGRFVTAFTGLVGTRLIIDAIGLTGFGNYQIAITYITIYWLLTDFGLNAVIVREMSADTDHEEEYFGSLITLRTILGVILAVVSTLVLIILPYEFTVKIAILLGTVTFLTQSISGATHGLFQVRLRYDLQLWANLAGAVSFLAGTIFVLSNNMGIVALVGAFVLGQVVNAVLSVILSQRLVRFHFSYDLKRLRPIIIATIPFGVSLLFNLANFKLDALLLSILPLNGMTNANAIGIYNASYKFFEFGLIIPTFLMNAVYPVMVKAYHRSFDEFERIFRTSAGVLTLISLLGVSMTYFLAPWVISLIADLSEFQDSVTVLRILMGFAPVFFLSSLLMWTVITFDRQNQLIWVYLVAFLVNLGLNLWAIPRYTYLGAAVATGISELVILILLIFIIRSSWKRKESDANSA